MEADWESLLPPIRGRLPSGPALCRTEPGGSFASRVVIVGVYPAARVAPVMVGEVRMNLPVQVERTSFELGVSSSSRQVDEAYLAPLRLGRGDVLMLDLLPYFLANTRDERGTGRTMAKNIAAYEAVTGSSLGIEARPTEARLVEMARTMPGNTERLASYFGRCRPALTLTLGAEAAACLRGLRYEQVVRQTKQLFYQEPVEVEAFGVRTAVVHLVHPGLLMTKKAKSHGWSERHEAWCVGAGRAAVHSAMHAPHLPP